MKLENENEIMRTLGKIEANQVSIIKILDERKVIIDKVEDRVDALERSKSWVMGAATVAGASLSYVINTFLPK